MKSVPIQGLDVELDHRAAEDLAPRSHAIALRKGIGREPDDWDRV